MTRRVGVPGLKDGIGLLLIVGLAIALPVLTKIVARQLGNSPHDGQGTCADCHVNDPEKAANEHEKVILVKDIDAVCKDCHKVDEGLSHPSNIPATGKFAEELPLDWAGRITCATCHYMHRGGHADATGYMIRTEKVGRAFCEQCHNDLSDRAQGKHGATMDKSHIGGARWKKDDGTLFDEVSLQCLGCHDGTVARSSSTEVAGFGATWQHSQIGPSHPIGVEYPQSGVGARQYRSVAMLDRRIRLFDGKLGCCSCHEPYSRQNHGLVMSNERSALCLECHLK